MAVKRLPHAEDLPAPAYATAGSAGADLCAAIPAESQVLVRMGEVHAIPTGVALEIPPGYEGQVRMRSGLALRSGLMMVNAPGTIDSDYRGEIRLILTCASIVPCTIRRGDRIAQIVISPVARAEFRPAAILEETRRGANGFGSTGVAAAQEAS